MVVEFRKNRLGKKMKVIVNSKDIECKEGTSLGELIKELKLEGKVMAAAVNMQIVKQDSWNGHILHESDKLELLDFVGGG